VFVTPAWAANLLPPGESTGGAKALSIMLVVGLVLFLGNVSYRRWRKRQRDSEDDYRDDDYRDDDYSGDDYSGD